MSSFYAVIMAGGEGTRFVPYSTPEKPKEFLPILHESKSMIRQTYERFCLWLDPNQIWVSTNQRYISLVREQIPEISLSQIVGEPLKKNTAPPLVLISQMIATLDASAVILFAPADHFIQDSTGGCGLFKKGSELAQQESVLVTFGVPPGFPSPDYGYIQSKPVKGNFGISNVEKFVEKPSVDVAQKYLKSGNYFWNSGIFVWKAVFFLSLVARLMPGLYSSLKKINFKKGEPPDQKELEIYFGKAPSISVDYAIMEKADCIRMIPFPVGWSDVGTWDGLRDLARRYQLNLPERVQHYLNNTAEC